MSFPSDEERVAQAGQRAAATMEAFDDPQLMLAHDRVGQGMIVYCRMLMRHGVESRVALAQMLALASAAWCQEILGEASSS